MILPVLGPSDWVRALVAPALGVALSAGLCPLELLTPEPSRELSLRDGSAAGRGHGLPRCTTSGIGGWMAFVGIPGLR